MKSIFDRGTYLIVDGSWSGTAQTACDIGVTTSLAVFDKARMGSTGISPGSTLGRPAEGGRYKVRSARLAC